MCRYYNKTISDYSEIVNCNTVIFFLSILLVDYTSYYQFKTRHDHFIVHIEEKFIDGNKIY